MTIKIEMEAEDALELCALHIAVMELGVKNIGDSPLAYSKAAHITNDFFNQVVKNMPMGELERLEKLNKK